MTYQLTIEGCTIESETLDELLAAVHHLRTERLFEVKALREEVATLKRELAETRVANASPQVRTSVFVRQADADRDAAFEARDQALRRLAAVNQELAEARAAWAWITGVAPNSAPRTPEGA